MKSVYSNVIIIGYGQIVNNCILKLNELKEEYGYNLTYIEYESTSLSTSISLCEKEGIDFVKIDEKATLTDYFMSQTEETLVISAGNFYIFPKEVVEKKNLTIINFHSALLPKYPGRNAQTWAIFCGEKVAGATWHFVTEELDAGKYIIQKECPVTDDTKAYELTGAIMECAYAGFCDIISGVLTDRYDKIQNIKIDPDRVVYKGKDVPGNGQFSIDDSPEYIYRLLRSTDYGKSDIFPPICTVIDNQKVRISNYRKIENNEIEDIVIEDGKVFIPLDNNYVLRMKYKTI